ncbi:MAG: addiction module protein [Burkholderiaceae bacterium]
MSKPLEVIEAEIMNLSQADRSRLVDKLIASLERDPEWEAVWSEEADRREERVARGESSWVPGTEAVARLQVKLA